MKLTEYPSTKNLNKDDILITDGETGTKKITAENLSLSLNDAKNSDAWNSWVSHKTILRGKNLGTEFTPEQAAHIADGTFEDLYIGDYWVAGDTSFPDTKWIIADINYWLYTPSQSGDTIFVTDPHLVIVPDQYLYATKMQTSSNTVSSGGYVDSDLYKTGLTTAKIFVNSLFGSEHILKKAAHLSNAVNNGTPTAGAWYNNVDIDILTEQMVFGCSILRNPGTTGLVPSDWLGSDSHQLALFTLDSSYISVKKQEGRHTASRAYWLRNIISSNKYAIVDLYGNNQIGNPTAEYGVRPVFGVK